MASRAIVLGITADHAFAAGTLLASIRATNPAFAATAVIFHDGLDSETQAAFCRLWPDCRFKPFGAADAIDRLGQAADNQQTAAYLDKYSPLVLAKLDLPRLLDDFEKIVWMDADILVRGALDPIWDFDCLAWRPLPTGAFRRRTEALAPFADRELDPSVPLLNGGIIGVSRQFVSGGGSAELLHSFAQLIVEHAPHSQPDELPWYLAAASLHLPVTPLPLTLNHPVAMSGVENAVVAHAIGRHKFWNATPLLQLFPEWSRHQESWVACGGTPYSGEVLLSDAHPADPAAVLLAARARSYWLSVFPEIRAALPRGMVVDLRHDRIDLRILLHGRPETEHLRLQPHRNGLRYKLEVCLPGELNGQLVTAICAELKRARRETGGAVSFATSQIAGALAVVERLTQGQ